MTQLHVIYEDNHLLVVNKAAGMLAQGDKTGDKPLSDVVKEYIKDVNADGESLREVFKKLADDYYSFGNAYLEGVLYDGGLNLYHIDATTVRMAKNKKEVYVHPDWAKYNTMKDKTQTIPLYPNVKGKRFVMHFKDYEPTFTYYGLPDYVAALEHIAVDYEIGKWNHTKFIFIEWSINEFNAIMNGIPLKSMLSNGPSMNSML